MEYLLIIELSYTFDTAPGTPTLRCHNNQDIAMGTPNFKKLHLMVGYILPYNVSNWHCEIFRNEFFMGFVYFILDRPS